MARTSKPIIEIDSYAALRGTLGGTGVRFPQNVLLLGRSAQYDGGEGQFVWTSDTTTADDDGTVIVPTVAGWFRTGCWKRLPARGVSVKWFGAPSNGSDAGPAFTLAVTAAANRDIVIPAGTYTLSSSRVLGHKGAWVFEGGAKIRTMTGGVDFFGEIQADKYQEIFDRTGTHTPRLGYNYSNLTTAPELSVCWFGADPTYIDPAQTSQIATKAAIDTPAIQRTLDQFAGATATTPNGKQARPGCVLFPNGTYYVNATCYYNAAGYMPLRLRGENQQGLSATGMTAVVWAGADNGTMLRLQGLNDLRIEHILFSGGSKETYALDGAVTAGAGTGAKWLLHIDILSTHSIIYDCGFAAVPTRNLANSADHPDSAHIALGDAVGSGAQADDLVIEKCQFGAGGSCVRFIDTNNCLNVTLNDNQYGYGRTNIALAVGLNSGTTRVNGGLVGGVYRKFIEAGFSTYIKGLRAEMDRFGSTMAVKIVDQSSLATPGNTFSMEQCQWFMTGPLDGKIMRYEGNLTLIGNKFVNRSGTSPVYVVVGPTTQEPGVVGSQNSSVFSRQNFYCGMPSTLDTAPFLDGSDNPISFGLFGGFYRSNQTWPLGVNIDSALDTTGTTDDFNVSRALRAFKAYRTGNIALQPAYPESTFANFKWRRYGEEAVSYSEVELPYTYFQTAALFYDAELFRLQPGDKLMDIVAHVQTAFGGTAGTLTFRIGAGAVNDDGLLVDFNAAATGYRGHNNDAHLGTKINRANAVQGGYTPDMDALTKVYARLTSSSGNLSGLNAGVLRVKFAILRR